ncbi:MAG: putative transcriptional regulator, ArsR family protein [Acidimicrobiia bacterium]|nr:MAG: putative transcriptional regulator, ArsR family protein [Acidimicrobiia bacterium]
MSVKGQTEDLRVEEIARRLKAVADPARLRILSMLADAGDEGLCVCHLTEPLGLSQPTVSHHMQRLSRAGLVDAEQRGRWTYYRLRTDALMRICEELERRINRT